MITRNVLARGAASLVLAGALVAGVSGCTFITPQATLIEYSPTDGIEANIGDVQLRNIIGVINEDGHAISLMVTIVNSRDKSVALDFQFESGGEKTTVTKAINANTTVSYGNSIEADQIVILNPDVPAGDLLPVYVQYGDEEGKQLLVPVLEATGDREGLAPPEILRTGE